MLSKEVLQKVLIVAMWNNGHSTTTNEKTYQDLLLKMKQQELITIQKIESIDGPQWIYFITYKGYNMFFKDVREDKLILTPEYALYNMLVDIVETRFDFPEDVIEKLEAILVILKLSGQTK